VIVFLLRHDEPLERTPDEAVARAAE
jgi:hypothetical protein